MFLRNTPTDATQLINDLEARELDNEVLKKILEAQPVEVLKDMIDSKIRRLNISFRQAKLNSLLPNEEGPISINSEDCIKYYPNPFYSGIFEVFMPEDFKIIERNLDLYKFKVVTISLGYLTIKPPKSPKIRFPKVNQLKLGVICQMSRDSSKYERFLDYSQFMSFLKKKIKES